MRHRRTPYPALPFLRCHRQATFHDHFPDRRTSSHLAPSCAPRATSIGAVCALTALPSGLGRSTNGSAAIKPDARSIHACIQARRPGTSGGQVWRQATKWGGQEGHQKRRRGIPTICNPTTPIQVQEKLAVHLQEKTFEPRTDSRSASNQTPPLSVCVCACGGSALQGASPKCGTAGVRSRGRSEVWLEMGAPGAEADDNECCKHGCSVARTQCVGCWAAPAGPDPASRPRKRCAHVSGRCRTRPLDPPAMGNAPTDHPHMRRKPSAWRPRDPRPQRHAGALTEGTKLFLGGAPTNRHAYLDRARARELRTCGSRAGTICRTWVCLVWMASIGGA